MNLYLHLTPDDLQPETGAVAIEKLGAATTDLLQDWLARHAATGGRINLRPVLDLADTTAVDQHDPPDAMREVVVLRDAHCVFPGCRRDSRGCDLDHITPYLSMDDGGPPGQTHPANLAPLCRTHHRIKTHTSWGYKRLDTGSYTWTAPTGHQYDVTPTSRRPPTKNLTPRHPGPPQPGTPPCPGSLLDRPATEPQRSSQARSGVADTSEPTAARNRKQNGHRPAMVGNHGHAGDRVWSRLSRARWRSTTRTRAAHGNHDGARPRAEPGNRNHSGRQSIEKERPPTSPGWFRQAQPTVVTQVDKARGVVSTTSAGRAPSARARASVGASGRRGSRVAW